MSKPNVPAGFPQKAAPARQISEEEKRIKIMQFLQQKRENFSINLLCHLVENDPGVKIETAVDKAVNLADALIEKLYPIPETKDMSNQ